MKANLDYITAQSTDKGYGASTWGWTNAVVGRALLAEYSATGNEDLARIMETYLVTNAKVDDSDGVNAEEALRLYGITRNPALLAYAKKVYRAS